MKPGEKPFNPKLKAKWDKAVGIMKAYLEGKGWIVRENPDPFGIDLICETYGVEVEVKEEWRKEFPFETLHIPGRKGKWADAQNYFVVFNRYLNRFVVVRGDKLQRTINKDTIYTSDERYYEVPLSEVEFRNI